MFSDGDPITAAAKGYFQNWFRGLRVNRILSLRRGTFLQENKGEEFARAVVDFISRTPFG